MMISVLIYCSDTSDYLYDLVTGFDNSDTADVEFIYCCDAATPKISRMIDKLRFITMSDRSHKVIETGVFWKQNASLALNAGLSLASHGRLFIADGNSYFTTSPLDSFSLLEFTDITCAFVGGIQYYQHTGESIDEYRSIRFDSTKFTRDYIGVTTEDVKEYGFKGDTYQECVSNLISIFHHNSRLDFLPLYSTYIFKDIKPKVYKFNAFFNQIEPIRDKESHWKRSKWEIYEVG